MNSTEVCKGLEGEGGEGGAETLSEFISAAVSPPPSVYSPGGELNQLIWGVLKHWQLFGALGLVAPSFFFFNR